jgi:hypothetical protein
MSMPSETTRPSGGRFDHEGDWLARQFFSPDDLRMRPEEYAARHAHEWLCFSLHLYRYRDPALADWMGRLGEILFTDGEVERCREHFLTPKELAEVRRREAERPLIG